MTLEERFSLLEKQFGLLLEENNKLVEDGHCSISNNLAENSVRGVCLGRKNWLFSAS